MMKKLRKCFGLFIIGLALGIVAYVLLHNPVLLLIHLVAGGLFYHFYPEKVKGFWEQIRADLTL